MLVQMQLGTLGVAVLKLECHRTGRFRPATSNLALRILEPVRQYDADAVLLASDRIEDRLSSSRCGTHGLAFGRAGLHVRIDSDFGIDGIVDLLAHGRVYSEE